MHGGKSRNLGKAFLLISVKAMEEEEEEEEGASFLDSVWSGVK